MLISQSFKHVRTEESILFKAILDAIEGLGVRVDRGKAIGYIDPYSATSGWAELEIRVLVNTTDFPTEVLGRAE